MSFHKSPLSADRLQKALRALQAAGERGLTTRQGNELCESTRFASDASELRANGVPVVCEYERETANGRKVWRYRLVEPQGMLL